MIEPKDASLVAEIKSSLHLLGIMENNLMIAERVTAELRELVEMAKRNMRIMVSKKTHMPDGVVLDDYADPF